MKVAEELLHTCYLTYARQPTGLAPEITYFNMNVSEAVVGARRGMMSVETRLFVSTPAGDEGFAAVCCLLNDNFLGRCASVGINMNDALPVMFKWEERNCSNIFLLLWGTCLVAKR